MFMAEEEEENVANEMKEKLIDIIIAMKFIGFDIERFSIEDILLNDMNNINYFYQNKGRWFGEKSYKFLYDLFGKYGGRTLLDVLENMYGKDVLNIDKKEEEEIKNLIKIITMENGIEIKLLSIQNLGNKIKLKIAPRTEENKNYEFEIEKDRLEGQNLETGKDYIASLNFNEKKEKFVLSFMPLEVEEEEEDEEIEHFEIDKTSSIEENFEEFAEYLIDEITGRLQENPEKIKYFTSVDYLKPFVEDFVNKIQTYWIYANLDEKLALKSFALYLTEQKGLNIERFKYLKEQYINIDIMLGTIILKQKIIDKYVKMYL